MAILPVALCPLLTETSLIDGQLDEDIWILPPAIPFFVRPRVRWIPEAQTQVFTSYDSEGFNIAFRCFDENTDRIECAAGPPSADKLYQDDLVGFRFIPEEAQSHASAQHYILTAAGKIFREVQPGTFEHMSEFPCNVQIGQSDWCIEGRLLFEQMGIPAPQPNQRWGFAAYRQRVGARWERSGWIEVGLGPFGETMPGWLLFEDPDRVDRQRGRAVEPYLRRFGQLLDIRIHQVAEAEAGLPPEACPVTRHRVHLMIRSLLSIKNDMLHPFHPDALRHYAQMLQYNVGRLDELIENLRQGEDPQSSPDGFVFLGSRLETDQQNHAYAVIQGRAYESTMPHPLIVLLNGYSDDWIADARSFMHLAWPPELDFLLAIPSGLGISRQYRLAGEDEVFNVIRDIRRRFSVDPQRTILLGLGPGANAAYQLGAAFPHIFSAVAIGGPVPGANDFESVPEIPFFYWIGTEQGWKGPLQKMDAQLRSQVTTLPVAQPEALTVPFLQKLVRTLPHPRSEVKIVAASPRYSRGEWARIDRPVDYSRTAKLSLHAWEDGRVNVDAANVGAFTIFPHKGPFVPGQTVRLDCPGREAVTGSYSQSLRCELVAAPKGNLVKTTEFAGPITEAFHGRLLYVYGTAGSEDQTRILRQAAYQACRWPQYDLRLAVKADTEVTDDEMAQAHLHLLGYPNQNSLLAKMAKHLPVKMNKVFTVDGVKFSHPGDLCQFIYPNPLVPGRYILVYLANSPEGWLYRGWFPKAAQPQPLPDLWVARLEDNPQIELTDVPPKYVKRLWFDATWQL